ncbi:hypothetical protein DFJ73DRAFT_946889, partial [Zopfochytrium polystomum]
RSPEPLKERQHSDRREIIDQPSRDDLRDAVVPPAAAPYERDRDYPPRSHSPNPPNHVLGVFNLAREVTEGDLREHFDEYGVVKKVTLIMDRQTGFSRGFGFIDFDTVEDATNAKNKTNNTALKGRNIKVDFSLTGKPHSPTPGQYYGKQRYNYNNHDNNRFSNNNRDRDRDRGYEAQNKDNGGDRRQDDRRGRDDRDLRDPRDTRERQENTGWARNHGSADKDEFGRSRPNEREIRGENPVKARFTEA